MFTFSIWQECERIMGKGGQYFCHWRHLYTEERVQTLPAGCAQMKSSHFWNSFCPPGSWYKGMWQLGNRMQVTHPRTHPFPIPVAVRKSSPRTEEAGLFGLLIIFYVLGKLFHFHFLSSLVTKKLFTPKSPKCQLRISFGIFGSNKKQSPPKNLYSILFTVLHSNRK